MCSNDKIELSPEVQNLRNRCSILRDELVELFTEKDHLLNTVAGNIQAQYAVTIGAKELEALTLDVAVRKLKATIENIQAIENQGRKANLEQIEAHVEEELQQWNQKVDKMLNEINAGESRLNNLMTEESSKELQKLYRSLAKKLHPDINPDLKPEYKAIWARVQNAYKSGDLQELRALQLTVDDIPEEVEETNQLDQLQNHYEKLKVQVNNLIKRIDMIKSNLPFTLEEKLDDPEWVEQQTNKCNERILGFIAEKEHLEKWLSHWKGKK